MNSKAQSFLEYAFLITVISAALTAMYTYMNRAMNARLKQAQVELNERYRGTERFVDVANLTNSSIGRQSGGSNISSGAGAGG